MKTKPKPKTKSVLFDSDYDPRAYDQWLGRVERGSTRAERFATPFGVDMALLPAFEAEKRDSKTDPYRVDFLPAQRGLHRVGLGMHPGRRDHGTKYDWSRDLGADFDALWSQGVRTIVCMVEAHEFSLLKIDSYLDDADAYGFDVIWYPVRDVSVPVSYSLTHRVCYAIWESLKAGDVLVHCRGGKGRSGTLVTCFLEILGYSSARALKTVRSYRLGAVETSQQAQWCEQFGAYLDGVKART